MRRATFLILSASATELPPNFITRRPMAVLLLLGRGPAEDGSSVGARSSPGGGTGSEQRGHGRDLEADPEAEEGAPAPPTWSTIHPKFWPKKPVMKVSGRKIPAITVSCLVTAFSRFETDDR